MTVKALRLDLRDFKTFKKLHVMQSFSMRLAANGKALLVSMHCDCAVSEAHLTRLTVSALQDYSKNTYSYRWSPDCWWVATSRLSSPVCTCLKPSPPMQVVAHTVSFFSSS